MAKNFDEVELLKAGSDQDTPHKGAFVGNMYSRENALEVRPGFGQIAQMDTTLGLPGPATNDFGFTRNLASIGIKTNFGHVQILTVVQTRAFTGNISTRGQWATLYSLVIYDETTRKHWEVVLHRHTGEFNNAVNPMSNWWACYETSRDDDYQVLEAAAKLPPPVFMVEYNDNVMFGSQAMGLWAYIPSDFSSRRRQQVDGILRRDFASTYGESSLCFRIVPQEGQFSASRAYLDTAGFPSPVDAVVFRKRLVLVQGRDVYFTDEGVPNAIQGINVMSIPSREVLTGCAEVNGNLLFFGPTETWLYRAPASSTPAQGGDLTKISDSIGCLSTMAKCRFEDRLVWADNLGVYASQGTYDITPLSESIIELFNSAISNPLTSYYQNLGKTDLSAAQPRSFWDWVEPHVLGVNLSYDADQRRIFITVPVQNLVLCFQEGAWAFWPLESMVSAPATTVATQANIQNPRVLTVDGQVYLVGGSDDYTPVDETVFGREGSLLSENAQEHSLYILKLGHGGALDRSAAPQALEDDRVFAGYYEAQGDTSVPRYMQLQEPTRLPAGYKLPRGNTVGASDFVYLFPLVIVPKDAVATDNYHLMFDFDKALWEPLLVGATTELDFVLPAERFESRFGYGYGAPINNVAEVQVYSNTAFVPQVGGGRVTLNWDGATGNGLHPWSYAQFMALNSRHPNPVIYLPFRMKDPTKCSMSLGTQFVQGWVKLAGAASNCPLYCWHAPHVPVTSKTTDFTKAQPVDWCFKSEQVGIKGQNQIKARTLYAVLLSHGHGTNGMYQSWIHGLYNASCSSDWKDYASQIVDFEGEGGLDDITDDEDKDTLRLRLKDTAQTYAERIFNPATGNGARWGTTGNLTAGNYLIGDEELNTITISDSTRGEHISWMVYGHMRDPAERLVLDSLKAALRAVAGRRRRGR